jgi:hypothetical protein
MAGRKQLKVPLRLQGEKSLDCGPACMAMVLDYYKKTRPVAELREGLEYAEGGTYLFDNARKLFESGLGATVITAHPMVFRYRDGWPRDAGGITAALLEAETKFPRYRRGIGHLRNFMEAGGSVRVEIPAMRHVAEAIDNGNPLVAALHTGALGTFQGGYHILVVSGYGEDEVHLTNPWPKSDKRGWYPADRFFYSLHTSTAYDVDNGSLLVVENKAGRT